MGDKTNFVRTRSHLASIVLQQFFRELFNKWYRITHIDNYLDVTGKTETEHSENLETALTKLQECGLSIVMDKCDFF